MNSPRAFKRAHKPHQDVAPFRLAGGFSCLPSHSFPAWTARKVLPAGGRKRRCRWERQRTCGLRGNTPMPSSWLGDGVSDAGRVCDREWGVAVFSNGLAQEIVIPSPFRNRLIVVYDHFSSFPQSNATSFPGPWPAGCPHSSTASARRLVRLAALSRAPWDRACRLAPIPRCRNRRRGWSR